MQPVDLFSTHHIRQNIKTFGLTERMLQNHILISLCRPKHVNLWYCLNIGWHISNSRVQTRS